MAFFNVEFFGTTAEAPINIRTADTHASAAMQYVIAPTVPALSLELWPKQATSADKNYREYS